jgi:hypothetical protein
VAKVGQRFAQLAAADDTFRQENFLSPTKKMRDPALVKHIGDRSVGR